MPTRESIADILRFALPALAAGVASKSGALGGGAFQQFTNNSLDSRIQDLNLKDRRRAQEFGEQRATEQDRLQSERWRIQDARQATMDKLSMDREQRLIAAEAADQEWRQHIAEQQQKAQARARMAKLTGSFAGAFKNPDFLPMVESQGPERFTIMTDEGPVPILDAMRELGLGDDPKNLRNVGGLFPPPDKKDDDLQEYTYEIAPGQTVTEMLTRAERRAMGRLKRNTERTREATSTVGEVPVRDDYGTIKTYPKHVILQLMEQEGIAADKYSQIIKDPAALQELISGPTAEPEPEPEPTFWERLMGGQ